MYTYQTLRINPATIDLNALFFDVERMDLVTKEKDNSQSDLNEIPIKEYKALINVETKEVLCVVSNKYALLTNKEAFDFGLNAFVQLFPVVKREDLIPFKVITSVRKTFCHIDLIHKDVNFNAWEQETWFPFIRITNSYNRKFKFSLELGFVRKLCSNGMIFDKKTIKIKYTHSKGHIPVKIDTDIQKLQVAENEFVNYLLNLKRFYISKELVFPMVCHVFKLNWKRYGTNADRSNEYKMFESLKKKTSELTDVYMRSNGENAFAVMNVMTDLVSHQDQYRNLPKYSLLANQYYGAISSWMKDFCEAAEKREFKIEEYLGEFLNFNEEKFAVNLF